MEKYVLDTNIFFNMEADMGLGDKTEQIIQHVTHALEKAKKTQQAQVFLPPSIVEEIKTFFDNPEQPLLTDFFAQVEVKSPDSGKLQVSSLVVTEFINEMRERSYRGMKVAEEEIQNTAEMFMGKEVLKGKHFQMAVGKIISTLRDRYRTATRNNVLDSQADIEIIMLALEQSAALVSTDAGVVRWGRKFGVKEMDPQIFGKKIQAYASLD